MLGALAALLVAAGWLPTAGAVTERIVVDSRTGIAINGFDPVAYFANHAARSGEGAFEYVYGGVVWRFCNEGNRAAFAHDPDVYMPRFGGYDPVALARTVARAGHPTIWLISGERLYLFSSAEDRDAFAASSDQSIAAAERGWRQIEPTLVP
jgi:YHS domain-containing protein